MTLIEDFVAGRTPPDLYAAYLGTMFDSWATRMIEIAPPRGHVLDIACGTGIVSRKLAGSVGVDHVSAIDIADPMLAKARAMSAGVGNVNFQQASADALPFEDDAFEAAYCQQGLQFFPDKVAALKEARRVTKPGGPLTFAVWTFGEDGNPMFGAMEEIVARELGDDLVPFGPFSFGDRSALESIAAEAGLQSVSVTKETRDCVLPDVRSLVLFDLLFLGRPGPDGNLQPLFDPSDGSKDALIEAMIAQLAEQSRSYQQDDGSMLAPMTTHILTATA